MSAVAAPAAQAATFKSISLSATSTHITSSTGKSLHVYLSANKTTTSGNTDKANLTVWLTNGKGETHQWNFQVSRSSFTYANGHGTLNPGQQIKPFGTLDLNFSKTRSSTTNCKVSGSATTLRGTLHGALHFDTNTSSWGNASDGTFAFATPNSLTINNGCNSGEGSAFCFRQLSWNGPFAATATGSSNVSGNVFTTAGGSSTSTMSAYHSKTLSHPAGASRSDSLTVREPAPTTSGGGNTLNITTRSTGPVSGRAKLTGGSDQKTTSGCKENGKTKQQHNDYHSGATWSSPTGHHLTFKFQATPDQTYPGSGTGSWSKSTVS